MSVRMIRGEEPKRLPANCSTNIAASDMTLSWSSAKSERVISTFILLNISSSRAFGIDPGRASQTACYPSGGDFGGSGGSAGGYKPSWPTRSAG